MSSGLIKLHKITYNPSSRTDLCTFIITYKTQVAVQGISLKFISLANTPTKLLSLFSSLFPQQDLHAKTGC